jgi:hypothetical protein
MAQIHPQIIPLSEFQTQNILQLENRPPDTYIVRMRVQGNSLYSSVYVRALSPGASVKINYYEATTGAETGERRDIPSHTLITVASQSPNTTLITPFHNMPVMEAVVTGGSVEFGVLVTVVATFASDLDSALKRHEQAVSLANDKGLPTVLYDPSQGKWFFAESVGGSQLVASVSNITTPVIAVETIATANTEQAHTFPANTKLFLIRSRTGSGRILLAHASGGPCLTISPGAVYTSPGFNRASTTIYLQSPTAGLEVELESWS